MRICVEKTVPEYLIAYGRRKPLCELSAVNTCLIQGVTIADLDTLNIFHSKHAFCRVYPSYLWNCNAFILAEIA
ncbi:hypothetical protein SDC9_161371 [bioreactor metagenome]|uniref:Uncharacterized protein n=1 Tax=bioreactor metagenome TaxID=1076179 RepID=A0A645FHZ1_9ZZZZ